MDFKVSYLDAGLATSYFEGDCPNPSSGPKLNPRRYKTQLRDFLSSCRTKRKPMANDIYGDSSGFTAYPSPTAYMTGSVGGSIPGYPSADTTLYMQQANIAAAPTYQTLYPGVDNRYLAASDYFAAAGYRSLGTYYPEYAAHAALGNGYLDVATGGGRIPTLTYDQKLAEADKLYSSSAAAYMSDPRLCSSLRLGTTDNKNGKDCDKVDKLIVKEEGGLHATDYVLSQGSQRQPICWSETLPPPSTTPTLSYTIPDHSHPSSVLYMYSAPESPKITYTEHRSGVSPPTLRLSSPVNVIVSHGMTCPETKIPGEVSSAPSSASVQTTCCTFSLSDFSGVPVSAGDSVPHPLPLPVTEVRLQKAAPKHRTAHHFIPEPNLSESPKMCRRPDCLVPVASIHQ